MSAARRDRKLGAGTSVFMFSSLINQNITTGWIYLGVVSTGTPANPHASC